MTSTDTIKVEIIAAVSNAIGGVEKMATSVLAAATAWKTWQKLIVDSVHEYMEAERAAVSLANAFRVQGQYSNQSMENMTKLAAQLQKITVYEDDATISAMAMLKQLTTLDTEGIMRLIPHVQDFAAAFDIDLRQAATLVAKTIGSSTNALSRYGIEVEGSSSESEKLARVIEQLDKKFGGLAETVGGTTFGQMEKVKNQMSDIMETVGGGVVTTATTGLNAWGLAWRNFWDVVLLRGTGEGTAAFDYLFKASVEYTQIQARMAEGAARTTQALNSQYQKMREMASDPVIVSIMKGLNSEAWKNLGTPVTQKIISDAVKNSQGVGLKQAFRQKMITQDTMGMKPFERMEYDFSGSVTPASYIQASTSAMMEWQDSVQDAGRGAREAATDMSAFDGSLRDVRKQIDDLLISGAVDALRGLGSIMAGGSGKGIEDAIAKIMDALPWILITAGVQSGNVALVAAGAALAVAQGLMSEGYSATGSGSMNDYVRTSARAQLGLTDPSTEVLINGSGGYRGKKGQVESSTGSAGGYTIIVQGSLVTEREVASIVGQQAALAGA